MKASRFIKYLGAAAAIIGALGGVSVAGESGPADAPQMRLLSQSQYLNTIAAIFGDDVAGVAKVRFAPVNRVDGLVAIGAATAVMTPGSLEPLEVSARAVSAAAMDEQRRSFLLPCTPAAADRRDDACAAQFLGQVGRLLYRRPLKTNELEAAVSVAGESVGKAGDFYFGLSSALSSMLVAPQFMYIQERARPGSATLDGYARAARLAFYLWDAGPDDLLLDAAARGELDSAAGLSRQIERMLASHRFEQGVRAFFNDMLVLETFDSLAKDPLIYPAFTLKVMTEAREQTLRTIVDHLVTRDGDYRDLFVTRHTFLTPDLGLIYQVPVDNVTKGWAAYEIPANDPRAGLLTQVGFLSLYSHAGRSSPTKRGRGLRESLLCQHVPDPPPNVNFSLLEEVTDKTARERLAAHNSNPVCAGCHKITDPIGLALENFDGAGQFRTMENGYPVDPAGMLDGVAFQDAAGLGKALRSSDALASCIVTRLYSYGAGQKAPADDVKRLKAQFTDQGYKLKDMLRAITRSETFYAIDAPRAPNN